ncbi:MAG: hypothetical protein ACRD21_16930 [Vicinamibacteria bacterium]
MKVDEVLIGRGNEISRIPFESLRRHLEEAARTHSPRLAFMTGEHHRVRDFVVTELPRGAAAVPPEVIAAKTSIAPARVAAILDELEAHRFFLVRDCEGRVSWAFPVTSEMTPHRVELSTGEPVYAA